MAGVRRRGLKMKFRVVFLMMACCAFFAVSTFAQSLAQPATISVTGTAELNVVPDSAVFSMFVEKINKNILAAKIENDESVGKILAVAKNNEIADKDVKTDFISVSKRYEFVGVGAARQKLFLGYAVSKTVIVKLKDLQKFESFFSDVLTTGVTEVRSVYFQSSEFQKHKKETRIKAIRAAKEKATEMAKAIGQSIGKAISIDEDSGRFTNANITANYVGALSPGPTSGTGETFSPGTITIRSQVNVKFLLE